MKKKEILPIILFLMLAFSVGAAAQGVAGLGAVSGTVRDATGAIIPSATVVVSNDAKGVKREMITTEAGLFTAPALVPGVGYSVTVSLPGFKSWQAKDFTIQVGQTVDFKVTLEVAGATTEVAVVADAPLVDTE